jgi:hypothetical protein
MPDTMIDLLNNQRNSLQWCYVTGTEMFLGQLFSLIQKVTWPNLPHFCVVTLFHISLASHSAVKEPAPRQCQYYRCSYSVYTSLSLKPHHIWGQYKLPWRPNLLPHVSEFYIYICLRSRNFPSPSANSEPAGSRQISLSPVRLYALTAAALEKMWRRVIVHQNADWHITAVCTRH